ncbi:MAG: calcium-binding protein [Pseudomonadota bacterium]
MALITPAARSEILALVVGMFGAAPGTNYLNQLVAAWEAGQSVSQIANSLAKIPLFNQTYPTAFTSQEFADRLVANLLGSEVTDAAAKTWATNWVVGKLNAGTSRSDVILTAVQALSSTTNAAYANAKLALANKVAVSEYYSVTKQQSDTDLLDLQSVIANVTSSAASVTAAKTAIDNNLAGQEFTLTISGDTIEGNQGNDSITGNASTASALDSIDGAGGIDTLTILGVDKDGAALAPDLTVLTVKNVEKLVVNAGATDLDGGVADVSTWGLTSATFFTKGTALNTVTAAATTDVSVTNSTAFGITVVGGKAVSVTNGAGAIIVTGGTGLTSVTTTGGSTVAINDAGAEVDTLTTVSLNGNTGAATIGSDKLTSLTLTNNTQDATVTAAAATRVLDLTLNKSTAGIVTDATATTVNVISKGAATTGVTVTAAAATSVTIAADEALTLAALNAAAATTLTVSGDSKVTLTALTAGVLTSINASASTSGMTITPVLANTVAFTGGAGTDTVSVGATTSAVSLGAGNDTATVTVPLGVGGTLTGGDGADTLVINAVAPFGALTGITGFETLGLGALANGAYVATGFTGLTLGGVAAAVSFTSVAAASGLTITAAPGFGVTYTLADATGGADSLPLTIKGAAAINANTITAAGVETIAITSDDTATTVTNITHTVALAGNDAKTITVGGDAGLIVTAGTGVTSFDASGITNSKVGVNYVTAALTAVATLTGTGGNDTLDATLATKAVTLNGGAGDDALTVDANNNTINGGDGIDTITAGDGNNTISGGAGNDIIVVGTGANTITAGDGNDTITIGGASVGLNTINVGAGTDTIVLGAAPSAAGFYTSVTGLAAGDKIDLAALGTAAEATLGAKITLGLAVDFANYLDAAAAGTTGAGEVNWFQLGGNTYITVDNSATATFEDGVDTVIELVGLVDLSAAVLAADVLTLA